MRIYRSGALLIEEIGDAGTFGTRLLGWFHPRFRHSRGVLLHPCRSIHTLFMPRSIDVIFLSACREVCGIVENLARNRRAHSNKAIYVLELPAGMAAHHDIHLGQVLDIER